MGKENLLNQRNYAFSKKFWNKKTLKIQFIKGYQAVINLLISFFQSIALIKIQDILTFQFS
jgi:hypothetical protein